MGIQDYLRALRSHWIGSLAILAAVLIAVAAYTVTQPKVYAANATGFVGTGESDNPALGSINDQLAKSRATSYVDIAKSRATAQQVIDDLGLRESPASLVGKVEVSQPVETVLLKITVRASTPEEAQRQADAYIAAVADQVKLIESPNAPTPDGTPRVVPIESAELPGAPVSPDPIMNGALGFTLGLILATAYAVVRQQFDRRLRRPDEIEKRVGHSVVAAIPAAPVLEHDRGYEGGIAVRGARTANSPAAEAFRKLRTNLTYMRVDNPVRSIVVTSARPGDGKSTVAVNLAAALDSTGAPVVLIDGDLRRPSAASAFGVDTTGVGLTSVLAGLVPLEDALQRPEGFHNLQVLPAGPPAPIPSELLGSRAMRELVKKLRGQGYVIIDAPPLLPVTDAAVLSVAVDGTLLVLSSGKTLDTEIQQAIDSLETVNSEILGLVVNRVSKKTGVYGYGYGDMYDGYVTEDDGSAPAPRQSRRDDRDDYRGGGRRGGRGGGKSRRSRRRQYA